MHDTATRKGVCNRAGAGRPRNDRWDRRIPHVARPSHDAAHPVHVTMRAVRGLPSLRSHILARAIGVAFHGAKRRGRRVAQFTIQENHLHLIVEADDRRALLRDLRGVAIAIAKRVARALRRRGPIFADRYHLRALPDPRSVRSALLYVLLNHKKHGIDETDIDPMSSARWFTGWSRRQPEPTTPSPVVPPRTALLATEWLEHGPISPSAFPRNSKLSARDLAKMMKPGWVP